jgi:class 3 adenylate cyclase
MAERTQSLNRADTRHARALRIGIGTHTGPAIEGEMNYGTAVSITAVGDSVNTASRIESLTKTYACELVISEAVVPDASTLHAIVDARHAKKGPRTGALSSARGTLNAGRILQCRRAP